MRVLSSLLCCIRQLVCVGTALHSIWIGQKKNTCSVGVDLILWKAASTESNCAPSKGSLQALSRHSICLLHKWLHDSVALSGKGYLWLYYLAPYNKKDMWNFWTAPNLTIHKSVKKLVLLNEKTVCSRRLKPTPRLSQALKRRALD